METGLHWPAPGHRNRGNPIVLRGWTRRSSNLIVTVKIPYETGELAMEALVVSDMTLGVRLILFIVLNVMAVAVMVLPYYLSVSTPIVIAER